MSLKTITKFENNAKHMDAVASVAESRPLLDSLSAGSNSRCGNFVERLGRHSKSLKTRATPPTFVMSRSFARFLGKDERGDDDGECVRGVSARGEFPANIRLVFASHCRQNSQD